MLEVLLQRVQALTGFVEQSVANHHALLGRLAEAKELYEQALKSQSEGAQSVEVDHSVVESV